MRKLLVILVSCLIAAVPVFSQNSAARSSQGTRAQYGAGPVRAMVPQGTRDSALGDLSGGGKRVVRGGKEWVVYSSSKPEQNQPSKRRAVRYYTNTYGVRVQSPTYYPSAPAGATARCVDGTYSFSQNRRGTCSHHGGVAKWL